MDGQEVGWRASSHGAPVRMVLGRERRRETLVCQMVQYMGKTMRYVLRARSDGSARCDTRLSRICEATAGLGDLLARSRECAPLTTRCSASAAIALSRLLGYGAFRFPS